MKSKRFLSLLIAAVMSVTGISASFTAYAEEQSSMSPDVTFESENMTVESGNSLGNLFSNRISEEMASMDSYNGNRVNSVEITDKTATVSYVSIIDCSLTVAIYDDSEKQMLASETVDVLASESKATVEINISEMPEYFYVKAYLTDRSGMAPLCEEYENPNYTSQMEEFFSKTVADFEEEKVLNFDEDTTNNFAVYGDDVTIVEEVEGYNNVVTCDHENGLYVLENADETITSLQPGDILSYDYGDETEIIVVKVDTISVDGTTVSITAAEATLDDIFEYIKIDEQIGQESAELSTEGVPNLLYSSLDDETVEVENSVLAGSEGELYTNHIKENEDDLPTIEVNNDDEFKISFEDDGVVGALDSTMSISLTSSDKYETDTGRGDQKNHFGIECALTGELEYKSKVSLKIYMDKKVDDLSEVIDNAKEINYFEIKWAQGLKFNLSLSTESNVVVSLIPLKYKLFEMFVVKWQPQFYVNSKATLQFTGNFTEMLGFTFGEGGCTNISENPEIDTKLELEGEITIGVDLGPQFYFVNEKIASVDTDLKPAIKLTATAAVLDEEFDILQGKPKDDHECLNSEFGKDIGCIDGRVDFLFSIGATGKLFDCEDLKVEIGLGFKVHLLDFYYSIKNKEFGWDKCPHKLYHYTITVTDLDDNIIEGAEVTCGNRQVLTDTEGKAVIYFVQGENSVTITKDKYETETEEYTLVVDRKKKMDNESGLGQFINTDDSGASATLKLASEIKFDTEEIVTIEDKKDRTDTIKISLQLFKVDVTINDQYNFPVEGVSVKSGYEHTAVEELFKKTGSDGKLTMHLPNGTYTLTVEKEGYDTVVQEITIAESDVTVNLTMNGDVSVFTVKDQHGDPVSGAKVDINMSVGGIWNIFDFSGVSSTDENGMFSVFLKPGTYRMILKKEGYDETTENITITEAVEKEILMKNNHVPVNVSVVDTDGNTVEGLTVSSDYNDETYVTDVFGNVTIMLPPGKFALSASGADYYEASANVTIEEGIVPETVVITVEKKVILASGTCGANVFWELDSVGTLRVYGTGYMNSYLTKNSPWEEADIENSIKKVIIEDGVMNIGHGAFGYCYCLTSVIIGNDVDFIGEEAFLDCLRLVNIDIPNNVTSIGENAFTGCKSFVGVTIGDGVTSIGLGAFSGTPLIMNQTDVIYADTWVVNCSHNLTTVEIKDGTKGIADRAFYANDDIESIIIPDSVTIIGEDTFINCDNLTSIRIPDSVTSMGDCAFYNCNNLTNVIIGDSVKNIGEKTFEYCSKLESVTIGDSITSIGSEAFHSCRSLTSITIGNSVEIIGKSAFQGCENLISLIVPNSVRSIGSYAFYGCDSLTDVYYSGTEEQWREIDGAFVNKTIHYNSTGPEITTSNYVAANVPSVQVKYTSETSAAENTFKTAEFTALKPNHIYNFYSLKSREVEDLLSADNVLYIAQGVSDENGNLTFEYIPREIVEQSEEFVVGMIYNISDAEVTIPDMTYSGTEQSAGVTVTYNGNTLTEGVDYTVEGTLSATQSGLYEVTIIGQGNYYGKVYADYEITCEHEYTDGVCNKCKLQCTHKYVDNTCEICGGMKPVVTTPVVTTTADTTTITTTTESETTPTSDLEYKKIDDDSDGIYDYIEISDCAETATIVNIPAEIDGLPVESIGGCAFMDCRNLESITIPDGVTIINGSAFSGCRSLVNIILPDSVTIIDPYAFNNCIKLMSIIIPDKVISIGNDAFRNCTSLESIIIPNSVMNIYIYAFRNCISLDSITIENPDCKITDDSDTIPDSTTIYGYFNSTAFDYATKYNRQFVSLGYQSGDVTGDGNINLYDAVEICKYIMGSVSFNESEMEVADYNRDDKVDLYDVIGIAIYMMGA